MGLYHSIYYENKKDRHGIELVRDYPKKERFQAWQKDTCLATRFDINMNWLIKLEGHMMNGAGGLFGADNYDTLDEIDLKEDWSLFAVKLIYIF